MMKEVTPIIQIDDILVSGEIVTECFCCDYPVCKGACCIIGDSGAPLKEDEAGEIERNYRHFEDLLSDRGREAVRRDGFFSIDSDGDMVTPLAGNTEECAYTCFDCDHNCLCAMEKRFLEGRGTFRKPVSCSLYPIRVSHFSNGLTALNLHRWDICKDAFAKGRREGIRVFEFLKEPLTGAFGKDFYEALSQVADEYPLD